jgi:hypothetical protein
MVEVVERQPGTTKQTTRSQALAAMLGVFVPLTAVATLGTPGNRLFTGMAMTGGFTVLIAIVMALWNYRPKWVTNLAGPIKDLDPGERRLVAAALRSGQPLADPRLAQIAVEVARRTAKAAWLMLAASALNLVLRVALLVGEGGGTALMLGLLSVGLAVALVAYAIYLRKRARRAEAANLEVHGRAGGAD